MGPRQLLSFLTPPCDASDLEKAPQKGSSQQSAVEVWKGFSSQCEQRDQSEGEEPSLLRSWPEVLSLLFSEGE